MEGLCTIQLQVVCFQLVDIMKGRLSRSKLTHSTCTYLVLKHFSQLNIIRTMCFYFSWYLILAWAFLCGVSMFSSCSPTVSPLRYAGRLT
uniref:Uncharacterized protein n=1 Tax=Anguilla anguilla TaxID=7936 RepID=A0A0E9QWG4_ANGAN